MHQAIGKYRWVICSLIFFATTINYLDRAVISLLKEKLEVIFKWTESDYANIVIAFQLSYAIGMLGVGRLIDKVGVKMGYALSGFFWSIAAIAHALVKTTVGFGVARAALGISEAGNFPSANKAVAEWFPKKERAFATGLFNAGANIGAIAAPLTVPAIAEKWGWQWAFIITGAIGFIWLALWMIFYDSPVKNARLKKAEYDYIRSDVEAADDSSDTNQKFLWHHLFFKKQTWVYIAGKFFTDPVWWFYLFWLPAFLKSEYSLTKTDVAFPIALVYTLATVGSIVGGWLPMYFIKKGFVIYKARKISMLIYALCALPVVAVQLLGSYNQWQAILLIGFVAAAHQAWSANMLTTVSDMFPKKAIASVTGIGGMAGGIGGILFAKVAGVLFDYYKSNGHLATRYYIIFFVCGTAYISAWLIMHFLVPKMKAVEM